MEKPSIERVLEYYGADVTRLKTYGWTKIRCPFHGDRSPSATVNLEENRFKCWSNPSCPSGDSIDVIEAREGLDFKDACSFARDQLGFAGAAVRKAARPQRYRPSWEDEDD